LSLETKGRMLTGKKIRLRNRKLSDARESYTWQSDPELAHLDASPVLTVPFVQYLTSYQHEIDYPTTTRQQFAIETLDRKYIGYCSYYGIHESTGAAELGIMIGNRDYWNKGYGTDAVATLLDYIFQGTKLNRVHLKTLATNYRAQRSFRKCGFTPYDRVNRDGYDFILMEIHRKEWERKQPELSEV
jgi:RimJ/RimL family protein N-acetyltransferase